MTLHPIKIIMVVLMVVSAATRAEHVPALLVRCPETMVRDVDDGGGLVERRVDEGIEMAAGLIAGACGDQRAVRSAVPKDVRIEVIGGAGIGIDIAEQTGGAREWSATRRAPPRLDDGGEGAGRRRLASQRFGYAQFRWR